MFDGFIYIRYSPYTIIQWKRFISTLKMTFLKKIKKCYIFP